MSKTRNKVLSLLCAVMMLAMTFCTFGSTSVSAEDTLAAGDYTVDASLSCYVNAMGGIEFGAKLFSGMEVAVKDDGTRTATLHFKDDSSLVIYTVNAHVFVNADKAPVGFYDADGNLDTTDVTYTKSANTALNPAGEAVNYLETMTFDLPASSDGTYSDTYTLYLYIDSQIMGVQFCDGSGTNGSNNPNKLTPYKATLTVDWDSAVNGSVSTQSSNVVYDYTTSGTYEVSIPATINVDKTTKTGTYEVTAQNFDISSSASVAVTAEASGNLYYNGKAVAFTNTLSEGSLKATGDTLSGTITVTGTPKEEGKYEGITTFTINYVSGK